MHQVFNNILLNAIQAMGEYGEINIKIENRPKETGNSIGFKDFNYVKISITDQGRGISQDIIQKIFDPYFTTNAKGTGLGLAITHKIIRDHGGRIKVETEFGKGTTFHIFLPEDIN